jgi:hypothetical protein
VQVNKMNRLMWVLELTPRNLAVSG